MSDLLEIQFIRGGMLTTVQDGGCSGWQHYGVPVGGFLDRDSAQLGNLLVGNDLEGPLLEMTYTGVHLRFSSAASIAVTGATCSIELAGKQVKSNRLLHVKPGDDLRLSAFKTGIRVYLAIAGEWQVEKTLGSVAAFAAAKPIRAFKSGDLLQVKNTVSEVSSEISEFRVQNKATINPSKSLPIWPGPELSYLTKQDRARLCSCEFTIAAESNRMALSLSSDSFGPFEPSAIISSGLLPGTIQCTPSGKLLLLMADAQTTGGYPRIAIVAKRYLSYLAQKRAGEKLRFEWQLPK